jgi:mono/diheme cytochrome c family protein
MIDSIYGLLAKIGYPHPLHPPIVHMTIGLVAGALAFFLVAVVFKRKRLALTARHASILALAFALPAILVGAFDWMHFYHGAFLPAIKIKMALAAILLILLGGGIILGGEERPRAAIMMGIYACAFAAVVGLGYFGGELVYNRSAAVAAAGEAAATDIGVSQPATIQAAAAAKADPGLALFEADCQGCHAGGGNAIVASLPIRGSRRLASLETFESFVRAPAMPDGKSGDMPAFPEDSLDDAQAKALYGYLKAAFK